MKRFTALCAPLLASGATLLAVAGPAQAAPTDAPAPQTHGPVVITRTPETHVAKVDADRLAVHRIDIVDSNGVIRMVLAADLPQPIVGGVQYKRTFSAGGLTLYDQNGDERGGYAVADVPGSAAILTLDHANGDAVGWKELPDGSVSFVMIDRGAMKEDPATHKLLPAMDSSQRVNIAVAADGSPEITLADKQERPRIRLTVTKEGFGALEFLNAKGEVVDTYAPEAAAHGSK